MQSPLSPSEYSKKSVRLEDLDGIAEIEDISFDNDLFSMKPNNDDQKSLYTDRLFEEYRNELYYQTEDFKEQRKKKRLRSEDKADQSTKSNQLIVDIHLWPGLCQSERISFLQKYVMKIDRFILHSCSQKLDSDGFLMGLRSLQDDFVCMLTDFLSKAHQTIFKLDAATPQKANRCVKEPVKINGLAMKPFIERIIQQEDGMATKVQILNTMIDKMDGKHSRRDIEDKLTQCLYRNFKKHKTVYKLKEDTVVNQEGNSIKDRVLRILNGFTSKGGTKKEIKNEYMKLYKDECSKLYWESSLLKAISGSVEIDKGDEQIYYSIK